VLKIKVPTLTLIYDAKAVASSFRPSLTLENSTSLSYLSFPFKHEYISYYRIKSVVIRKQNTGSDVNVSAVF
jgi:hypothetical protein